MRNCILMDLDGTLTDPGLGITNSIQYALRYYDLPVPDRRELYCYIGPPLIDSFQSLWGFSREKAEQALGIYRRYFATTGIFENEVYPGIPALLQALTDAGCRLYLATSKPEIYAEKILEHFSLKPFFTDICGNTLEEDRPSKEAVLRYLLDRHPEVTLQNAVMVGDRRYDILGAHAIGLPCIAVGYGYGSIDELQSAGADAIAPDIPALRRLLLEGKTL